jgi:taurine dioxygenase
MDGICVKPLSGGLGAQVTGIDVSAPIGAAVAGFLYRAFLDHRLLCFPGAPLPPVAFGKFAGIFGTPMRQVLRDKRHRAAPEVSVLDTTFRAGQAADKTALRAASWHTDGSHFPVPYKATLLHAHAVPATGGKTRFCDMYAAYNALPGDLKQRIDGLFGVHCHDTRRAKAQSADREELQALGVAGTVTHLLARPHPETGRKALFFSSNRLDRIEGLDRSDSDALLDTLYAHADQAAFHYAHAWRVGDIVVWDNRCLMHAVTNDYPVGQERIMLRAMIKGETR